MGGYPTKATVVSAMPEVRESARPGARISSKGRVSENHQNIGRRAGAWPRGHDAAANAQDKGTVGIAMPTKSSLRWISDGNELVKALEAKGYETDLQYAEDDIPEPARADREHGHQGRQGADHRRDRRHHAFGRAAAGRRQGRQGRGLRPTDPRQRRTSTTTPPSTTSRSACCRPNCCSRASAIPRRRDPSTSSCSAARRTTTTPSSSMTAPCPFCSR